MRPLKALALMGDAAFVAMFVGFCIDLGIQDKDVCQGAVGSQAPIMAHVLRSVDLDSPSLQTFCSTVFGLCPLQDVKPRVLELSPLPTSNSSSRGDAHEGGEAGRRRKRWESKGGEPFQVVHISDSHVDWKYAAGAEAQCSKIICCRRYPELEGAWPYKNASKFGEPKCDTPPALLQSMLQAVDLIAPNRIFNIFTGDAVDDAVWDLQIDIVAQDLSRWHASLAGNGTNTSSPVQARPPSYPAFGNHDVVPVNAFPRNSTLDYDTRGSPQWAYELCARDWERWIGGEAAAQVRTRSGCYSRVHPGTNLRIISLNTNYWYKQNFWAYDSNTMSWDSNGIIMWLASELDEAEKAGQRAWIIGHMPPGKADMLRDQSNYINQVFQRYHNTIAAQFYGHSHADEFEVGYSDYELRSAEVANGISFIAGSLTPTGGNPVFRVYDVDPDTYEIMDFTPYYANLTAPSFQDDPEWQPYYSARASYGTMLDPPHPSTASLNARFWHRITDVFEKNGTAFQLYNTRLSRGGAVYGCDDQACISSRICMARAMRSQDNCQVVQPHFSFRKRGLISLNKPTISTSTFSPSFSSVHHPHQHDHFACEGPGLPSMLRALSSGVLDARVQQAVRAQGNMWKRGEVGQLTALRLFQEEAQRAVKRHRAKKRWWRRWT
ncbi:hypothetical protein JCM11251_001839 [Rhodosporidiobolus azoricus]